MKPFGLRRNEPYQLGFVDPDGQSVIVIKHLMLFIKKRGIENLVILNIGSSLYLGEGVRVRFCNCDQFYQGNSFWYVLIILIIHDNNSDHEKYDIYAGGRAVS